MTSQPSLNNDKPLTRYTAIVTVDTDSIDNADQVLRERINYDEDYGFSYKILFDELQPEKFTRGIIIDASEIRNRLEDYMANAGIDEDDPNDKLVIDAHNKVESMDDGRLNALISSIDDDHIWELFNELADSVLHRVIDEIIDGNIPDNPS